MRYQSTIHIAVEADDETQADIIIQEWVLNQQALLTHGLGGTEILWLDEPLTITPFTEEPE